MGKISQSLLDPVRQFLSFRGARLDEIECFKRTLSEPGFMAQLTNLLDYYFCWIDALSRSPLYYPSILLPTLPIFPIKMLLSHIHSPSC